ncbi:MAG: DUF4230 domain-containing protein [Anaerovoracaceae bacterium]
MNRREKKLLAVILCTAMIIAMLSGCTQKKTEKISLTEAQNIVELATLKVYYHNVAKLQHEESGALFGIGKIGYKQMWFEYTGIVSMGIDASKLVISEPTEDGVVTVEIPNAQILGSPDIDEESLTEPLMETGWFTKITGEEKKEALTMAQMEMKELAEADNALKLQAKTRAKELLENYIKNVGKAIGREYSVEWEEK